MPAEVWDCSLGLSTVTQNPWSCSYNQCCRSRRAPPNHVPACSACSCCCLSQFWGRAKAGSLFWLQHQPRAWTEPDLLQYSSHSKPGPRAARVSFASGLGMSSAGKKCRGCKFYLSLWGSVMGAEEKAAAGTCGKETHRENWLKAISHPYLRPVPLCSALCKADSTSSALTPQSSRGELKGWGKAPRADHRPCRA